MQIRQFNTMKYSVTPLIALLSLSTLGCVSQASFAEEKRQNIRIYKLNSKDQSIRIQMLDKTAKSSGCHNFFTKPRVSRITQIGFASCTLYSTKNCPADAAIEGQWEEEDKSIKLTQGGKWLFTYDNPKGIKAKSWSCE